MIRFVIRRVIYYSLAAIFLQATLCILFRTTHSITTTPRPITALFTSPYRIPKAFLKAITKDNFLAQCLRHTTHSLPLLVMNLQLWALLCFILDWSSMVFLFMLSAPIRMAVYSTIMSFYIYATSTGMIKYYIIGPLLMIWTGSSNRGDSHHLMRITCSKWDRAASNLNERCVEFLVFGLACYVSIEIVLPRIKRLIFI